MVSIYSFHPWESSVAFTELFSRCGRSSHFTRCPAPRTTAWRPRGLRRVLPASLVVSLAIRGCFDGRWRCCFCPLFDAHPAGVHLALFRRQLPVDRGEGGGGDGRKATGTLFGGVTSSCHRFTPRSSVASAASQNFRFAEEEAEKVEISYLVEATIEGDF